MIFFIMNLHNSVLLIFDFVHNINYISSPFKVSNYLVFLFLPIFYHSQVVVTTSTYNQNFGTSAIASWTNNSTFLGWYVNDVTEFQGDINITAAAPTNTGGVYVYRCSGISDRKFGSRASAGTGTIQYGVRFVNNSGSTINSITVSYTAYQLSLAENNSNTNTNTFAYRVVASPTTITNLTAGVYTNVAALNYTAPTNHGGPGTSNQVNGIPCTTSSLVTACVPVVIQNNGEIMLRWTDIDNSANDHHLAIDNVEVVFNTDNACAIPLPVEIKNISAFIDENDLNVNWTTASERNNNYFEVLLSDDSGMNFKTIGTVKGAGTSSEENNYSFQMADLPKGLFYIRLKQVDFDGRVNYSEIRSVKNSDGSLEILKVKNNQLMLSKDLKRGSNVGFYDITGKQLASTKVLENTDKIDFPSFVKGLVILKVEHEYQGVHVFKLILE